MQILESGVQDIDYLSKLLDYAINIVIKLGAPARDDITKAAHEKLVEELSDILASTDCKSRFYFANTLVKGLRFVLEQIQVRARFNMTWYIGFIEWRYTYVSSPLSTSNMIASAA